MNDFEAIEAKLVDLEKWASEAFHAQAPTEIATHCRRAGEALAKVIILKKLPTHETKEALTQNFNAQIDLISRKQDPLIEDYLARAKVKQTLHLMRVYANPGPHDTLVTDADTNVTKYALGNVLSWFYLDFLDRPLPKSISSFDAYVLENTTKSDQNHTASAKALEIVQLCHPKKPVLVERPYIDSRRKISYEFVRIEVAQSVHLGFVFLKKSTLLAKTFEHIAVNQEVTGLANLTICTPHIYHHGKEVDRLNSLQEVVSHTFPAELSRITECHYVDNFVWDKCIAPIQHSSHHSVQEEQYFVDQGLFLAQGDDLFKLDDSLDYVRQLISASEVSSPINVILGTAGVGKTTFCEQAVSLVNSIDHKIAVYISATDLRNVESEAKINTISDLYRLFLRSTGAEFTGALDPENLELNLACGNIILVIDALDEIGSILKDRFNLEKFLESTVQLNESYHTCSVIITSRDYHAQKYSSISGVLVLYLCGFNEQSVKEYFLKRLGPQLDGQAHRQLSALPFTEEKSNRQIPLYLSLICDLVERREDDNEQFDSVGIRNSRFFVEGLPLDTLVYQILDREIEKQKLRISCDDYFELLSEIAMRVDGRIVKKDFDEYVSLLPSGGAGGSHERRQESFYISPFLNVDELNDVVALKYDFLRIWLRARKLITALIEGAPLYSFEGLLADMSDGTSMLLEEACQVVEKRQIDLVPLSRSSLSQLLKVAKEGQTTSSKVISLRKCISGLLYLLVESSRFTNRNEYSSLLVSVFETKNFEFFSVFGEFVPVDFSNLTVSNGWFEDYSEFSKCKFPNDRTVFYYCVFRGEVKYTGLNAPNRVFDSTCDLHDSLGKALAACKETEDEKLHKAKGDLYKVLKVGFQGGGFVWKSELVYKHVSLSTRVSENRFLDFLVDEGVLIKEDARGPAGFGYLVAKELRADGKELITNSIVKPKIAKVIKSLMKRFY